MIKSFAVLKRFSRKVNNKQPREEVVPQLRHKKLLVISAAYANISSQNRSPSSAHHRDDLRSALWKLLEPIFRRWAHTWGPVSLTTCSLFARIKHAKEDFLFAHSHVWMLSSLNYVIVTYWRASVCPPFDGPTWISEKMVDRRPMINCLTTKVFLSTMENQRLWQGEATHESKQDERSLQCQSALRLN